MALNASLNRSITASSEAVSGQIDEIQLPFQQMLETYALLSGNEGSAQATMMSNLANLLSALSSLNIALPNMLLNPTQFYTHYTSSLLTDLTTAVTDDLNTATTGITSAVEDAIMARHRSRVNFNSARAARRISVDISKRLPYAGIIADKLFEADQDASRELNDANNSILELQAKMTYDMNRMKVTQALELEKAFMAEYQSTHTISLDAYAKYDTNLIAEYANYYDALIKRALEMINPVSEYTMKLANARYRTLFDNYFAMSKLRADGELRIAGLVNTIQAQGIV